MMNPTPEQVAAQVAAIVKARPDTRVIGIYSPGAWTGGDTIPVNGSRWPLRVCGSPLEISEHLCSIPDRDGLVILTPLTDQALSLDLRSRIFRRQLVHIDRWQLVREAFGATQIDPRLPMHGWVADALLTARPERGFDPLPSGWLDSETAWRTLLDRYLGIVTGSPDAGDIIEWSMDSGRESRYQAVAEPLRSGLLERLAESAGELGAIFSKTIESGHGSCLLPIGLVCEVLLVRAERGNATLSQAIARLEPFVGGRTLNFDQGRAWFEAAKIVLDRLPAEPRRKCIERAEGLLADLKADRFAGLSTVFGTGFEQRLAAFGKAIIGYLDQKTGLKEIEDAFNEVLRHNDYASNRERVERLEMALKLVRRLEYSVPRTTPTLGAAIESHLSDGVFVDWARRYLLGGDPIKGLGTAFGRLYERVREFRESQNRAFAERFRDWNRLPGPEPGYLPIEHFLDKVIAPLASKEPVLVVVVDGMDGSVFAELSEDLRREGWARWADSSGVGGLLSAIPSVTEFSRTALLTGRMAPGSSATEKSGFAHHAGLRSISRHSKPPVLFHKSDLTDAAARGLAPGIREAINNPEQRIVGVVVNAVDDHLAKSEQLRIKWTINSFRVLDALLYEARIAGRVVVLTADHGHVLEENGARLEGGAEQRWRAFAESLSDQEMVFEGTRIRAATGLERVVVLWSEATRYCQKKNGYHGGATPQEAVVPMGILLSVGQELDGWQALAETVPEWWLASASWEKESPEPPKKGRKKEPAAPSAQVSLFDVIEAETSASAPGWLQQLIDSEVYAAQLRLAGRLAPPSKTVRKALVTLEERHRRVPKRILAQAIQEPEFRLRGILAGLQRLLNVDGYQVLSVEEATETILLDLELLKKQFQLGD